MVLFNDKRASHTDYDWTRGGRAAALAPGRGLLQLAGPGGSPLGGWHVLGDAMLVS